MITALKQEFPQLEWKENELLAPYSYMKVGGPAEVLWEAHQLENLVKVVRFLNQEQLPFTVLGGASNVVVKDEGISGLVIINRCDHLQWLEHDQLPTSNVEGDAKDSERWLQVASGMKTAVLVGQTATHNLTGLEPFLGVPGTLGGAIFNNSHYQHELIGDYVQAVEVLNLRGDRVWLRRSECDFAYDASRFQTSGEVILQVLFALPEGDPAEIRDLMRESTQKRASSQPLGTANSGCMFKNVELTKQQAQEYDGKTKLSAGWLIDQAGLKGTRVGGAVVSTKHANFIVNENQATSEDIEALISIIIKKVKDKFGIQLEREVFFLGKERS